MWVNAARTSTVRGLETGTLWIGECSVLLICLIFEWKRGLFQHGCIYQKLADRNTSFAPYPLISWLISVNFDLLWYFFQALWWGCGTDSAPCWALRFYSDKMVMATTSSPSYCHLQWWFREKPLTYIYWFISPERWTGVLTRLSF